MLGFIQRYQKIFLIVVAVFISISFLFFGIIPKGPQKSTDKTVYRTLNKQKVKQSRFEGLKVLLNTNNGDNALYGKAIGTHYFTENFVSSDLIKPGILGLLVDRNLELLEGDLKAQHQKENKYQFYSHPSAPFLNADTIWSIHAPELKASIELLKGETNVKVAFENRQKLYAEESRFSSFDLWKILNEQESQFQWIPKDSNLNPQSLQLFGYHSLEDWFGEKLMGKVCEFIFEVDALAKKQGYRITDQEAEQDLMSLNEQNFMRIKSLGVKDFEDSQAYLEAKLKHLGMNRMQMVSIWKDLLLFRRFFQEAGTSVVLDSYALEPFEHYAAEQMKVARFSLPEDLQFHSMKDLMQFEVYLEALGKPLNQLALAFEMGSLESISNKYPQLVERPLEVQYKKVTLANAALNIKVQDIWNWKLDPNNYQALANQFPKLRHQGELDLEDYQDLLEHLDTATQMQMDQFVREILLKENTDWLEKAFSIAEIVKEELSPRKNGQGLPFKGLEVSSKKELFLDNLFKSIDQEELGMESITFNEQDYYQVVAVSAREDERLVSFQQLKEDRTLEKLLAKRSKKGSTNSQNKLEKELFEPLKREIRNDYLSLHKESSNELTNDFYCKYRMYYPMRLALEFMKDHSKLNENYAFNSLWTLRESPHTYIRYLENKQEMEALLPLKEGHWTSVKPSENDLIFTQILSHPKTNHSHMMQKQIKNRVNRELKQAIAFEILDKIQPTP